MKKKKLLIGLISLGVLATTGCGKIPKLENGEEVVASLDGKNFTANDLYNELKKQGGSSVLVNMIDTFITNQEITDSKEAEEYAASLIKQYKLSYKQNGADFEAALISNGYANEDEFKKVIATDYKKSEIAKKYIKADITDDELKDYYDNHISDELSVKHILIAPEVSDNATDEEKTNAENAALEKAKNLIEQLNNGADFDTLAKENSSDDATKNNGGVINNVVKEGYVTEFWNAAYALENGKYTTEPVKTQYGYHIIYKVSHTEKKSLDEMKDTLYNKIVSEKISNDSSLEQKTWVKIREKYNLAINDSTIDSTYKSSIKSLEK
jgi:foldase protein PrsA